MASGRFAIDGICHPCNFSEENLKGRFGRIFNAYHDGFVSGGVPA